MKYPSFFVKPICLLAVLAVFVFTPPLTAQTPQKYAISIGLNASLSILEGVQQLRYAEADVDTLEKILRKQGYKVTTLRNSSAERGRIIRELYKFAKQLRENDWFLLYYAGHGVRNKLYNEQTYWLTYDADLRTLDVAGIRLKHLLDFVSDIKANRKLILLDHCFSGDLVTPTSSGGTRGVSATPDQPIASAAAPAGSGGARDAAGGVSIKRGAVPINAIRRELEDYGSGMVIIAAARNESLELETFHHGLFTHVLGDAFTTRQADQNGDANLSIDELKSYLKTEIPKLSLQVANFNQQVVESTVGVNLTGWIIANNLPLNNLAETEQKVQEYKSRLDDWKIRYDLALRVKVECKNCLDRWLESEKNQIELDEKCAKIVKMVREHLEETSLPEEDLARELEITITQILNDFNNP